MKIIGFEDSDEVILFGLNQRYKRYDTLIEKMREKILNLEISDVEYNYNEYYDNSSLTVILKNYDYTFPSFRVRMNSESKVVDEENNLLRYIMSANSGWDDSLISDMMIYGINHDRSLYQYAGFKLKKEIDDFMEKVQVHTNMRLKSKKLSMKISIGRSSLVSLEKLIDNYESIPKNIVKYIKRNIVKYIKRNRLK